MKAWRLHAYHSPLRFEDVPEPQITEPTDVIVKIGGAGVCRTDLHLVEGVWAETLGTPLPHIIGHENAGWVAAVGSGVTEFRVGDPVILHPVISCGKCLSCRAGEDMHCENMRFPGLTVDGGYAQFIKTGERSLIRLEDHVRPDDVAPLADAGITAYRAVRKAAPLATPGTTVTLIGMGGLGHIAVQLMRELGSADILAVDTDRVRLDLALEYGADRGVLANHRTVEQVRDLTKGRGSDIIIDFVGTDQTHAEAMRMLRKGGTYFVVGYGGVLKAPSLDLINNEFNIIGNLVGNYTELYELMQLYARGKVRLHATKYELSDGWRVLEMLDKGQINGRAVLVP
ncbi:NAD(P)-dependent alcohol dehydrogenase [Alicyclobacillus macrosporangiidus]|uniref:NAD(P)-dependent alcohol dehydrogenase n=1 Tax=Alicyclobacillus macrosporangiidus TaxID=392015 RepID=UPI000495A497|nr:NAD(P)-dependent alcohol dehydrogenase [Alicyclobacillus macrosporangiidus]